MLPSASALASRREERVQKAFSVDHHGPGDARLSHGAIGIYGELGDTVKDQMLEATGEGLPMLNQARMFDTTTPEELIFLGGIRWAKRAEGVLVLFTLEGNETKFTAGEVQFSISLPRSRPTMWTRPSLRGRTPDRGPSR